MANEPNGTDPKNQRPPKKVDCDAADERSRIKSTLPMGSIPIIKGHHGFNPQSSATKAMQSGTFPPEQWSNADDLISSASAPASSRTDSIAGTLTLNSERMPENLAREVIGRRFEQYDYKLVADYPFTYQDTVVMLDGFDPDRSVGFQYLSHADQDVVTDHDVATTETLKILEADGLARVLVIHDGEVITGDALISIVDKFLATPSPS